MEQKIYENLSKALPKEAIQKSEGSKTGKGYDTTGYGYQYIVNRLNEVVGIDGWNYEYKEINRSDGVSRSGTPRIGVCVEIRLTIAGTTKPMVGGHTSNNYTDALKGAITNSLKKAAAMFGVGKEAYEKTIDEDNLPPDVSKKVLSSKQGEYMTRENAYQMALAKINSCEDKKELGQIKDKLVADKKIFAQSQKIELIQRANEILGITKK